jgi:hypothetical protein
LCRGERRPKAQERGASQLFSLAELRESVSELLDHTFCTVYEIYDSFRNFLITPVLFSKCDSIQNFLITPYFFEVCDSIRNFLITLVLFSKYVTVFGTSWSHLYSLRNMWQYQELIDHNLYSFRNMCQYSELLDHTFYTVFEISDSIRWRNLTVGLWRMAQTDVDFWTLMPGLNPTSVHVGFVEVKKVMLRQVILWALQLSPVNNVPICSVHISHPQCILSTSFQPLWKILLKKNITVRSICQYICGLLSIIYNEPAVLSHVYISWTSTFPNYSQKDATFSRSIYFYKLVYMFQAVSQPIIRST